MRNPFTGAALGLIAAALLAGCGGPDPANPGPLTADEQSAAEKEMEAIENAEMEQAQQFRANRQSR